MLKIDLLKGQGIPIKSRPGGVALLTITFAVPIVAAVMMISGYIHSSIIISTQKGFLKKVEQEISDLNASMKFIEIADNEITKNNSTLEEVRDVLEQNAQWSEILRLMAQLPGNLILEELDIRIETEHKTVERRDSPSKKISIILPKRILTITISGKLDRQSDLSAMTFLKKISDSNALKEKTNSIRIISKTSDEKENNTHYMIECIFKT